MLDALIVVAGIIATGAGIFFYGRHTQRQDTNHENAWQAQEARKRMDGADTVGGDCAEWLRKRGERGRSGRDT